MAPRAIHAPCFSPDFHRLSADAGRAWQMRTCFLTAREGRIDNDECAWKPKACLERAVLPPPASGRCAAFST